MRDYIIAIDRDGQPYIAHHGILGQKWGVRRYQNKDGTRTTEGKKRYAIDPEVKNNAETVVKILNETDRLTWDEFKPLRDKYIKELNSAIDYIIDHDDYITERLKEANEKASYFDEDNESTKKQSSLYERHKKESKIVDEVNKIIKDCNKRYKEIINQAGGTDIEADDGAEYVDENLWLRVRNFGY